MSSTNYYIANELCVVAGDVPDNHAYYQAPGDRLNAVFTLEPTAGGFLIKDRKHGMCLVAGDVYDGSVYHQDPAGRPNAVWKKIVLSRDANGGETVRFIDSKHGKALASASAQDVNLYHQDPGSAFNTTWRLQSLESKVCLRAYNGQYVQLDAGNNETICTKRVAVGGFEPFDLINLGGDHVALRASNGNYVSAVNGGASYIVARQADGIGPWEIFTLTDLGSGSIALQAQNGDYWSSDREAGGVPMMANRAQRIGLETFGLVKQPAAFSFESISGSLAQVARAADGAMWGLDPQGNIYQWTGSSFSQIPGVLRQISVGSQSLV